MALKREIKDAYIEKGAPIYVKTHSNAVYTDENETETLTQRLDNVKDSITKHASQLDTIEKEKNIYKDYDFVKKYKAKCDGITDDTQALQNMINDSEDGVYIKLPPTTIRLNGSIVINNKSVTIEGSYNCIFDRRQWFKRMLITIIASLAFIGVAGGLFVIECSK